VYLRFKKVSKVCNFHSEISDSIFSYDKMYQPLQKCPLIVPQQHTFLLYPQTNSPDSTHLRAWWLFDKLNQVYLSGDTTKMCAVGGTNNRHFCSGWYILADKQEKKRGRTAIYLCFHQPRSKWQSLSLPAVSSMIPFRWDLIIAFKTEIHLKLVHMLLCRGPYIYIYIYIYIYTHTHTHTKVCGHPFKLMDYIGCIH
jgi:hypothetical protein